MLDNLFQTIVMFSSYIVPFLAVLTVIVFIHELGHFLVARWCGVKVDTFAVGFGKGLLSWRDRHDTEWKIGWLPLGGYVKFHGDANAASMPSAERRDLNKLDPGDFHGKPVWQRAAIVAAGPLANFLLAIAIFTAMYTVIGKPISQPLVESVKEGSAAEVAGILPGDIVREVDGTKIESFMDIQRIVTAMAGVKLDIAVERGGELVHLSATPQTVEIPDGLGGTVRVGQLGISRSADGDVIYRKYGAVQAVGMASQETWFVVTRSLAYIKAIIVGRESADQLAGPIRIAQVSGEIAAVSFAALVHLGAVLSISIGLINLFPIPMLDGGHLMYYAVEAVRGKPLGETVQEWGFKVGMAVVLMLMLVATWNDLSRLNLF